MIFILLLLILISNAVTASYEKSIVYSRLTILGFIAFSYVTYNNLFLDPLSKGIGLFGNLFVVNVTTQTFNLFIVGTSALILTLTAFYPRAVYYYAGNIINNTTEDAKPKAENINDFTTFILNKRSNQFLIIEYALITVFILCGAVFLISAADLISIFLSIELQSYGLYILSTLYRNSESATGSGLTYFLLGGLSSCFILFGSALIYANSGTTALDNIYIMNSISELTNNSNFTSNNSSTIYWYSSYYITVSLIIFVVGFLFKISAAPFHFWSPDVYDGIPTIVTTFVAIITKISIFAFIVKLTLQLASPEMITLTNLPTESNNENYIAWLEESKDYNDGSLALSSKYAHVSSYTQNLGWKNVLIFSSLMSLIVGSVLGLTQSRIKRLFAYSTISHVGFILLALTVATMESIQGYIFYVLQYSISNLNAFLILVSIGFTLFTWTHKSKEYSELAEVENSPIQLISQLKGFFYVNTFISISLTITLFSFVGIPPLIGFFAKQMVLSAALDSGYTFMTLIGVITSVIGAVYYLNIIKEIFFSDTDFTSQVSNILNFNSVNANIDTNDSRYTITINSVLSVIIAVLTIIILTFIYMPNEWFTIANIISITLFKL